MPLNHEYYMQAALAQARIALAMGEVPVGAVIVDNEGRIIAGGCNQTLTLHDPSAHAEMVALRAAGRLLNTYRLTGMSMYVTLEPCCMCSGAIIHARLNTVVFGACDPKTGACGSLFNVLLDRRHNYHPQVIGGVMSAECASILSNFFKSRRLKKNLNYS